MEVRPDGIACCLSFRLWLRGGHIILLGLGPTHTHIAQVEAACEDPSCPSCYLRHPRLHPTACPKGIHAGQDERRHSAPPPLAPNTGSLFRKAWRGGGKVRTCQQWQAGVSPAGSPSQRAQPDRLRVARGGEQSLASWHGQHGGVPAQVPGVEPGEEVQEGQEVTRGSPISQGFFLQLFWRYKLSLLPIPGHNYPLPS